MEQKEQISAVEWLAESLIKLEEQRDQLWSGLYLEWFKNFIDQAKEMEKKQIEKAIEITKAKLDVVK